MNLHQGLQVILKKVDEFKKDGDFEHLANVESICEALLEEYEQIPFEFLVIDDPQAEA